MRTLITFLMGFSLTLTLACGQAVSTFSAVDTPTRARPSAQTFTPAFTATVGVADGLAANSGFQSEPQVLEEDIYARRGLPHPDSPALLPPVTIVRTEKDSREYVLLEVEQTALEQTRKVILATLRVESLSVDWEFGFPPFRGFEVEFREPINWDDWDHSSNYPGALYFEYRELHALGPGGAWWTSEDTFPAEMGVGGLDDNLSLKRGDVGVLTLRFYIPSQVDIHGLTLQPMSFSFDGLGIHQWE